MWLARGLNPAPLPIPSLALGGGVNDTVLLILLGALSGLVSGVTGFGSGLILMGTLVAVMPVQQATVIAAVLAVVLAAVNLHSVRREIPWREVWPTLVAGVPAVVLGVRLLTVLDEAVLRAGVAFIILVGVASVLWTRRGWRIERREWGLVAGAASGVFNGALGTGGPPLVIYALLRGWDKECCKAFYSVMFLLMGAFRMVLLIVQGVATGAALGQGMLIVLPVVGAWYVGAWIFRRSSNQAFRYAGAALLAATAVNLLADL